MTKTSVVKKKIKTKAVTLEVEKTTMVIKSIIDVEEDITVINKLLEMTKTLM